ncbi:uncharacterized protein BDZ99DRAFT_27649 [Mytilinidion resinicola]|uniref:Uncharacterized protein n=1 Tax=Mytilinidion resinicola TaxID=574789 RepID=A0A6A6YLD5_9PEZI|nr:uncharacterized protein BDZ99DRAFT_27649 [Mytilinidion resinicola]KAF2809348.1 hypothetical protein BDZ99DRAFT_27649 [Mytilinidion resinicola]
MMASSGYFQKPENRILPAIIFGQWASPIWWRCMVLLKSGCSTLYFFRYINPVYWLWIILRSLIWAALYYSSYGFGLKRAGASPSAFIYLGILGVFVIASMSWKDTYTLYGTRGASQKALYTVLVTFWCLYFITDFGNNFHENYMQSHRDWRSSSKFVMFIDNKVRLEVPFCEEIMDDRTFLKMLGHFYYLRKAEGRLIEALSAKSLARIDVVKAGARGCFW